MHLARVISLSCIAALAAACSSESETQRSEGALYADKTLAPALAVAPNPALNGAIKSIRMVGSRTARNMYCENDTFEFSIQPLDASEKLVAGSGITGTCALLDTPVGCEVQEVECYPRDASLDPYSLVIIDNSGSMQTSDPNNLRYDACADYVNKLGTTFNIAVGDYGPTTVEPSPAGLKVFREMTNLRVFEGFSKNPEISADACSRGNSIGGTPLYGSLVEGSTLFAKLDKAKTSQSILLLTDGAPTDEARRESAINALKGFGRPVYAVGLIPKDDTAGDVQATLQALAKATDSAYNEVTTPESLQTVFTGLASALRLGQCRARLKLDMTASRFPANESIAITLNLGTSGASTIINTTVPNCRPDR